MTVEKVWRAGVFSGAGMVMMGSVVVTRLPDCSLRVRGSKAPLDG
jgi:hypothetical protein